jgi:hypothetical protein
VGVGAFIAKVHDGGRQVGQHLAGLLQARHQGVGQVFMDGMAKAHLRVPAEQAHQAGFLQMSVLPAVLHDHGGGTRLGIMQKRSRLRHKRRRHMFIRVQHQNPLP